MSDPLRALIAVDGSATALAAARCWSSWRSATDEVGLHATLLHVAPPLPHAWPVPGTEPGTVERALVELGDKQLEAARAAFAPTALAWESAVHVGAPAAAIVAEAQRRRVDLVVMGTRGLNPLRGMLLGSVAQRVAQASHVPVWLMPPAAPCPSALGRRLRLLVGVDGSPAAERAAVWAARIAPRFGEVTLELFSVQPPFSPLEGLLEATAHRFDHWSRRIGESAIDAARRAIGAHACAITEEVCSGETVEQIGRRADATGADAIVIGPRGLGAVGQALLGSVCNGLLQTARRSLIVVPEAA